MSEGARWSAGAVARTLGVSPTTLRTWDRRYGLGPRTREEGKHRRYDDVDVAALRRMLELTGQGMSPAAAATMARGGAGPVPDKHDFLRAATQLDAPRLGRLTTELIDALGVIDAWESVLTPFFVEIGERAVHESDYVGIEHVASSSVISVLHRVGESLESGRLPVLLASAPEELHTLPLDALAAALAEQGCASRNLGARVPPPTLLGALDVLAPHCLVLWAHDPVLARRAPLVKVAARTTVLLGGPGWRRMVLPEGARRVESLREAVTEVLAHSGRSSRAG